MKARAINKALTLERKPTITFEISEGWLLNDELLDGRDIDLTIKKYSKKRSLNANAYMWELCTLLAEKINVPKDEVYREAIRTSGIFRDMEMSEDAVKTFETAWEMLGTGWITERVDDGKREGTALIRAYYGTSRYNSKQMSRVIDGLVQDCKASGIPTLDDQEIERLIEEWNQ